MAKRSSAPGGLAANLLLFAICFSGCSVFFDGTNLREDSPEEDGNAGSHTVGKGSSGDSSGAGGSGSTSGKGGTGGSGGSSALGGRGGSGGGGTGGGGRSGGGGQSGTGGTGGAGGGSECDQADPNETNDDPTLATALPDPDGDGVLTPCESNAGPVRGTFESTGDDWFVASGRANVNGCTAKPAPYAYILGPGSNAAEICYYLKVASGAQPPCAGGFVPATDAPEGFVGCCGPNEAGLEYTGPDTEILIRLRPTPSTDACVDYELFYQY